MSKKLKILFIGRVEEDTGIRIYLESLKILKAKKINFEFEVCGDGSLANYVAQYYKVHGFVEDLNSYISKADFIFTSSYLSILQVLALKRLVFAAFDNSIKEDYLKMAPFAKWMVIEKNPKAIAEKVRYYSTHPKEKEKIVDFAFNWVKEQTWEKVADIYLRLWSAYEKNYKK